MSRGFFNKRQAAEEGAPAWVVTFADLMSLLLCFFVLLLSFSEIDRHKYKQIAGSMAMAFGIQTKKVIVESPRGDKIISRDFDREAIVTRDKAEIGREVQHEIDSRFTAMKDLVKVQAGKDKLVISLMGESTFDSGRAEIRPEMTPLLRKIAEILRDSKDDIIVVGHTDNVPIVAGPYRTNLELSMARAATVADRLIRRESIQPNRIATLGFGEYRPVAVNETEEGRKRNRRVEIILGNFPDIQMRTSGQ